MGEVMNKKEEFKEFLKRNSYLSRFVNDGSTTYQKLFETYDIYGENSEVWNEFRNVKHSNIGDTKVTDSVKSVLNNLKNVDLDKLEENISSLEKALGFLEEIVLSRSEKKTEKKTSKKKNADIERFFWRLMRYDIKESIYKDPNLLRFLRENSSYYKRLNRGESLDNMINEMKSKYGLRFKDKVDKVSTGIDLINAFMNVTKE